MTTRWEYRELVHHPHGLNVAQLDLEGAAGWETVSVYRESPGNTGRLVTLLRRPFRRPPSPDARGMRGA